MSSEKRLAANRRNAKRSTGPRSAVGKQRSRMNALKHGLDAQTLILPGEDEAVYRARLDAWRADIGPRDPLEESLVEEAVLLSWQLERADRVQSALLAERFRLAAEDEAGRPAREAAEADRIGQQLIAGPPVIPGPTRDVAEGPATRRYRALIAPDGPDHPARLLHRLEASAAGCRWLLDRWAELLAILDEDPAAWWGPGERVRAVRLLGLQPIDAVDDPMVRAIYLCSFRMDPAGPRVFNDQAEEMTEPAFHVFLEGLAARRVSDRVPPDRASAREELLALVDGIIEGLESLESVHAERASAMAETEPDRLAFDDSPEGIRIGRLQNRLTNALLRTIGILRKIRRHPNAVPGHKAPAAAAPSHEFLAPSPVAPVVYAELRNEPTEPDRRPRDDRPGGMPTSAWACDEAQTFPSPHGPGHDSGRGAGEESRNEPTDSRAGMPNEPTAVGPDLILGGAPVDEATERTHRSPEACREDGPARRVDGTNPRGPGREAMRRPGMAEPGVSWGPSFSAPPLQVQAPRPQRKRAVRPPPARPVPRRT